MNIILPDSALDRLYKKKINNLVIDIFENGRQTYCYSNSPSEWSNFSTKKYKTNGYKYVYVVSSEKLVHRLLDSDTIILLDVNGFKAAYWEESSLIIERPINAMNKMALAQIIPAELRKISDPDLIDQIASICDLPITTNPARKYLLGSKLHVLNWDFLPLDRSTKQFFKYRNDYVNVKTNFTLLFKQNNFNIAMTIGSKESNSYMLKLLGQDLDMILSIKNLVANEIDIN